MIRSACVGSGEGTPSRCEEDSERQLPARHPPGDWPL